MPPQVRNHSFAPEQIVRTPNPLVTSRAAETDLLNKLHVTRPPASGAPERAAIASQAEDRLLTQLHASPTSSVVTVIPPQQKATAAQSAESTLLKALQVPTPATVQARAAPAPEQNATIVTIIPGRGQTPTALPTTAPTTVPAAGQTSQIVTIIPGKKEDTTVAGPLTTLPSAGHSYTFAATRNDTIQIAENGKTIATTTPLIAAQQYGYHLPNPPIQGLPTTPVTTGMPVTVGKPVTIATPTPLETGPGVASQTYKDGLNASYNASAAQAVDQFGNLKASIALGNISGSLAATTGPLPLSATDGVNGSASLVQGQMTDRAAGLTITGNALSVQGSAAISASPFGASVTATAGAYLVQGQVDKQITIGKYDVNVGVDGGVGAAIGGTQSVGINGVAGDYSFGPAGLFYSVRPD